MPVGINKSDNRYRLELGLKKGAAYIVLGVITILSIYPLVVMVINSLKSNAEIDLNPSGLPINYTLENYVAILGGSTNLLGNFWNSIFVSSVSTVVTVFVAALAAFAFAKYNFRGRNFIFAMLLATTMVPGEISIPPLYLLFAKIDWLNTYQVQIVPSIVSVFGLFMIRQYMLTIPTSLVEAARIDGAGHWQIFWLIILPISSPVLGAFAILHFLGMWNSYLWPLLMANKSTIAPLNLVLPTLTDPQTGFLPIWGSIMAGSVLSVLPIVVVFIFFQNKFMDSVVIGSVKG
jgi:ABC-type glycerol-3-phosphate transport system permease component